MFKIVFGWGLQEMNVYHDVFVAMLGWAIPLVGAWVISKVPTTRNWFVEHKEFTRIIGNCVLSILISATAIFVYDRFFLASLNADTQAQLMRVNNTLYTNNPNLVEPVAGRCPVGTSVAAIGTSVVSGGPHGLVESVNFKCGGLQFQKP